MSRIICSSLEFVFTNEVKSINEENIPVLNDGIEWKKVNTEEKLVYQSNIKQNDAGPTNEETVSVSIREKTYIDSIIKLLIEYCGFYTILRLRTDDKIFYVGSLEYPCVMEHTSNKVISNISFRAISPT